MAYFESNFSDDLIKQLYRLENTEDACRKVLSDSVPILKASLKSTIRSSHVDTGELADSIEAFEPRKTKSGNWIVSAAPTGKVKKLKKSAKTYSRSKHKSVSSGTALFNSDKLYYLEYGTSKQTPSPVIEKATRKAENEILEKMQQSFNEIVGE